MRKLSPNEFIAQGDKVVVLGYGAWTAMETGLDFDSAAGTPASSLLERVRLVRRFGTGLVADDQIFRVLGRCRDMVSLDFDGRGQLFLDGAVDNALRRMPLHLVASLE